MMNLFPSELEDWLRRYYFSTAYDLGSSGVESFDFAQLRMLTGLSLEAMDRVIFNDSKSLGGDQVRDAVARRFNGGDSSSVMVTHGSTEAIFLAMHSLLLADDEVILTDPIYHELAAIPHSIGCRLKRWVLRPEDGFKPDLAQLKALLSSKTKMIVVNFPHNPTGVTVDQGTLEHIAALAADVNAYLFWDGAFSELQYGEAPVLDPRSIYHRTISIGTLSKGYGLPGLRVGWCLAESEILERCLPLRDNVTLHLSPLVELVAEHAIRHGDVLIQDRLNQAKANRTMLHGWIADHEGLVNWTPPMAGVCSFVEFPRVPDVRQLCADLAEQDGVLLIPGDCFGHKQFVRLGFGGSSKSFNEGLSLVSKRLKDLA